MLSKKRKKPLFRTHSKTCHYVSMPFRRRANEKSTRDSSSWTSPRISLVKGERYVRELKKSQS